MDALQVEHDAVITLDKVRETRELGGPSNQLYKAYRGAVLEHAADEVRMSDVFDAIAQWSDQDRRGPMVNQRRPVPARLHRCPRRPRSKRSVRSPCHHGQLALAF